MQWKILSEGVQKSSFEDIPKMKWDEVSQFLVFLVFWFDLSEVIWLLFKIQMIDDLMQYELY